MIYLNAAILGTSKQEIARKFDEIVDFAEMSTSQMSLSEFKKHTMYYT